MNLERFGGGHVPSSSAFTGHVRGRWKSNPSSSDFTEGVVLLNSSSSFTAGSGSGICSESLFLVGGRMAGGGQEPGSSALRTGGVLKDCSLWTEGVGEGDSGGQTRGTKAAALTLAFAGLLILERMMMGPDSTMSRPSGQSNTNRRVSGCWTVPFMDAAFPLHQRWNSCGFRTLETPMLFSPLCLNFPLWRWRED